MDKNLATAAVAAFIHQTNMNLWYQTGPECTLDCLTDLSELFVLPDTLVEMVEVNIQDMLEYPDERNNPAELLEWLRGY